MAQALAKNPGVVTLAVRSWKSALAALLTMLPLFAVVTAALFGLNYLFPILEQAMKVIRPASTSIFVLMVVPGAWVFALEKLALGLAVAPAALATMRHVLIEDGWRVSPAALIRFWCWTVAVLVLSLGALYVAGLCVAPELNLISIVLKGIAIVLPILLLLVFPAVAADEPTPGIAGRIDTAIGRWDGNLWRIVIVLALTAGPAMLLQRLPAAVILRHAGGDASAVQAFDATIVGSVLQAALQVLLVAAASAGLAWVFTVARQPKVARQSLGTTHRGDSVSADPNFRA